MFTLSDTNTVTSDEGFSVTVLGRTGLLYVEGNRVLRIDSEVLAGPAGMAVYSRSIRAWDAPHDGTPIDDAMRARVLENVRAAFKFWGNDIDVL